MINDDTPGRLTYPKIALIFLIVLGVVTVRGVDNKVVISAAQESTNHSVSQQLSALQSYISTKPGARLPLIYSKAYVLLDGSNGDVIISDNANTSLPIASTTKMTTALVALDKLPLDKVVTVGSRPPAINGSAIGLKYGEKITVLNLLRGLLIHSGNDAAAALADAYAGTDGDETDIVKAMNEYVKANHITATTFSDPAGLDDDWGRSTPNDLANIARLLLQQPILSQIVNTPNVDISSTDGQITHQLKNTNRLIEADSPYYLPAALGVKTGYTPAAGHCLVGAYRWKDRILIGVVLNTSESSNTASAQEMNKLFRWADTALIQNEY